MYRSQSRMLLRHQLIDQNLLRNNNWDFSSIETKNYRGRRFKVSSPTSMKKEREDSLSRMMLAASLLSSLMEYMHCSTGVTTSGPSLDKFWKRGKTKIIANSQKAVENILKWSLVSIEQTGTQRSVQILETMYDSLELELSEWLEMVPWLDTAN